MWTKHNKPLPTLDNTCVLYGLNISILYQLIEHIGGGGGLGLRT